MDFMSKMTHATLRQEISQALNVIADKHGIMITLGSGSYTGQSISFKTECKSKDFKVETFIPGQGVTSLGNFIGKQFIKNGRTYQITDYQARRWKHPVIAKDILTGQGYKFSDVVLGLVKQ